jgi:protein kinase
MLAAKLSFRWPQCARTDLKKIIHSSNNDGIDLIDGTLNWDPKRRPSAVQVKEIFDRNQISLFFLFLF